MNGLPKHAMYNTEIDAIMDGVVFDKIKYLGTYSINTIPSLKPYCACITNNKRNDQEGEHWIALIKDDKTLIHFYDSFGRSNKTLHLPSSWKMTDNNIEQRIVETNCGSRCIAWLKLCDIFGVQDVSQVL